MNGVWKGLERETRRGVKVRKAWGQDPLERASTSGSVEEAGAEVSLGELRG